MFYFSMTDGFLWSSIHGKNIPADAAEISEKTYAELLNAQNTGQTIQIVDGVPVIAGQPALTDEQLAATERQWRDTVLSAAERLRDRHRDQIEIDVATTLSAEQFTELLVYMQALRDWPQSLSFPDQAARPATPAWMVEA